MQDALPFIPTLEKLAVATGPAKEIQTGEGVTTSLRVLHVRLSNAGQKPQTGNGCWDVKPLVQTHTGEAELGEIAVLRALEADGWEGVWVNPFQGLSFWKTSFKGQPVRLPEPADRLFQAIKKERGSRSGVFDVMAWRGERFLFVEYKGPKDRVKLSETLWISAALRCGVTAHDLLYVFNQPDVRVEKISSQRKRQAISAFSGPKDVSL